VAKARIVSCSAKYFALYFEKEQTFFPKSVPASVKWQTFSFLFPSFWRGVCGD
jgi:hypothetical protein